ncbi:iron-sulfur cluster carrier protein ApbC [Montanilutibacter psychrotolerans]|uniref:Iron-sulfur cluster carrier protein n=1 Tax=Montanilutibacter psychrotolerans TaxID=1327343 RepID=A0A3M8T0E6_9GAMM|nr:iron-sulfur cluster carrier protein ApbC [Lysobacter psychrotolerans]RNF85156.1 iron-sulfur cluster carrier protein ApbC [Lysobacter psychrotolerans]
MTLAFETQVAQLRLPSTDTTLAEIGARVTAAVDGSSVAVSVRVGVPAAALRDALQGQVQELAQACGWTLARLEFEQRIASHAVQPNVEVRPNVRNLIAIASGKGGVGKSTTAVNLALALAADGARVGVLDADIYGPSVPMMLGLHGRPDSPDGKSIEPMRAYGIEAMSIGLLVEQDTPMIWRGPMATSALTQLLNDTRWGELDYLVVDLPPGTGDIQLTLAQKIPVAGAVIVTTPQDVATLDARKALKMFEKVEVPVLGLVENMAVHVCSNCGHAEHVFGEGGGARMAQQYGVPLLGSLPLELAIREQGDAGRPVVVADPQSTAARSYQATARRLAAALAQRPHTPRPLSVSLLGT